MGRALLYMKTVIQDRANAPNDTAYPACDSRAQW